jgi:energy-coupling factor transport system permease protein
MSLSFFCFGISLCGSFPDSTEQVTSDASSLIGTMDTRTKAAYTLFNCVCAFVLTWEISLIPLLIVITLPILSRSFKPLSHRSRRALGRFSLYAMALTPVLILLNSALLNGGETLATIFGIRFSTDGFVFGVRTAVRLLLLSFSLLIVFLSTPMRSIAAELQRLGLPTPIVVSFLLALHFLDRLPQRVIQIFAAQEARGAPIRSGFLPRAKSFLTILAPLILMSMSESIDRSIALELRAFHSGTQVLEHQHEPSSQSRFAARFFFGLSLLLVLWSIIRWG